MAKIKIRPQILPIRVSLALHKPMAYTACYLEACASGSAGVKYCHWHLFKDGFAAPQQPFAEMLVFI